MQTIKSVLVPAFPRSLLLALLLLAMALLPVAAADGDLDPTFDSDGSVTTAIGSAGDVAYAVAIQDDGKIVVGGTYVNGTPNDDLFLARYNSDGSLDTTFDSDGIVTVSVAVGDDEGLDVALQSDGKILLAGLGKAAAGKNHFILFRYNSDGSLDTSFDSDGMAAARIIDTNYGRGRAAAVQSDGKIVMAGDAFDGFDARFAAARFNSDGSLDTGFDTDGQTAIEIDADDDYAYDLAIQTDGKIVLAGKSNNGSNDDIALLRLNSDGSVDTSFDSDGIVITAIGAGHDEAQAVAIQSDGKIVVVGSSHNGSDDDFAVVRYNSDGSLDTSFDSDGIVITAIGTNIDQAHDVHIQADGKILVAGLSKSGDNDMAVVRYNSDGSLDTTFGGGDGIVLVDPSGGFNDMAYGLAVQSDGKIVLAGESRTPADVAVVRLDNTDAPAPGPMLDIAEEIPGLEGEAVDVPIDFTPNDHEIQAIAFTVHFDPDCLLFDPTDGDSDGVPDAIAFRESGSLWDQAVNTDNAAAGSLRFVIGHRGDGLIAEGVPVTITFTGDCVGETDLTFSSDSYGNSVGESVPGTNEGGSVLLYAQPVAVDDAVTIDEDTTDVTVDVVANDSDPNGGSLTLDEAGPAAHGALAFTPTTGTINYGLFEYWQTLAAGESETVEIPYTISNEAGGSASATLRVTVNGVNDAPVAEDDLATTGPGSSTLIDVLANASDVDASDVLVISDPGSPSHGSAAVESGQLRYTPADGFYGVDSFDYTVGDGHTTATATLTVIVGVRGDCNQDGVVDAGDLPACVLEIFDGDDNDDWLDTPTAGLIGNPIGCDSNQDTRISAADLSCKVRLLLEEADVSCADISRAGAVAAELSLPQAMGVAADGVAAIPLHYRSQGNRATALAVSLRYDPAQASFDSQDRNGDNIPDGLTLHLPATFQALGFTWGERINLVLFSPSMDVLPDGVLATLHLAGAAGTTVAVEFNPAIPASLGDVSGASLPLLLSGGTPVGPVQQRIFLPALVR